LVIYTDGVTESQNIQGSFFDEDGLVNSVKNHLGDPAEELVTAVLTDIRVFSGDAPLVDDIALGVLIRAPSTDN
jgi:serine phosphatase RsbU (regulator of sigma subunit)